MSASNASIVVCVTAGTGFLGAHVVKAHLDRGYTVNTTVSSVNDEQKLAHLKALPGATERLRFFEANLLEEGAFDEAIKGTTYVLHTASPFFIGNATHDNILDPAVRGTLIVLQSCAKTPSVRRVVLTSTVPSTHVYTEADWSPEDLLEKNEICLVALKPTWIFGPMLQPTLNESNQQISRFFTGNLKNIPNDFKCGVDVRDLAAAHVAAFENPAANGRYIPTEVEDDGKTPEPLLFDGSKAVKDLSIKYTQMAATIADTCQSLVEHGLVQASGP